MGGEVYSDNRRWGSTAGNATLNHPADPVFLKKRTPPGISGYTSDSSRIALPASSIRDNGTDVATSLSAYTTGRHDNKATLIGVFSQAPKDSPTTFIGNYPPKIKLEGEKVVAHQTAAKTTSFHGGIKAMVNMYKNGKKVIGKITPEMAQKVGLESLDALKDALTPAALAQLAAEMAVGALAGGVGAGVRAAAGGAAAATVMAEQAQEVAAIAAELAQDGLSEERANELAEKLLGILFNAAAGALVAFVTRHGIKFVKQNAQKYVTNKRKNDTTAKSDCACALPVIIATGEKKLDQTDFMLPGPIALAWRRRYRSGDARPDGWFGQGWSHPLATELWLQAEQLQYFDTQGRSVPLPLLDVGAEHFAAYEQFTLARPSEHAWLLRHNSGHTHHFQRLAPGQWRLSLCAITDRNGNRVQLLFDRADFGERFDPFGTPPRPTSVIDSAQRRLDLHWSPNAQLQSVSHVLVQNQAQPTQPQALAHYAYAADPLDPTGLPNLASQTNPTGQQRQFEYKRHLLVGYTLASGQRHRNTYEVPDAQLHPGARVSLSEAIDDGIGNEFKYQGRLTWVRDRLGRVSAYEHDAREDIVAIRDALGHISRSPFDSNGHPKGSTDPLGRSTSTLFDRRGNLTQLIDAAGNQTKIEYNDLDLPVKLTDAMEGVWLREYDARGNLVASTDPLGQATRYEVDAHGQVVAIVDALGKRKTLRWDGQGNLTAYTDCSGKTTRFAYDGLGHLAQSTDALGQVTRYAFDPLGRLQHVTQPDGAAHHYQWDGEGNLTRYTDPLGQATRWRYNRNGDPLERVDALGQRIAYRYDAAGRLTQLTNENGARTVFGYDVLDRLTDEIGFDGRHQRYVYNAAGELTHLVEAGGSDRGPGKLTRFARDALGRLTAKTHEGTAGAEQPDFEPWKLPFHAALAQIERHGEPATREPDDAANARFAYDKLGRLTQAANAVSTVQFAYDPLGQLLAETQTLRLPSGDTQTFGFAHQYDPLGNRIQTTLPGGHKLNQLFYGSGHLHQINLDGQPVCEVERDDLHREVQRSQGLLASQFAYDPAGRLKAQRVVHGAPAPTSGLAPWTGLTAQQRQGVRNLDSLRSTTQGLIERHYEYDPAGQLRNILDRHRGLNHYGYDAIGRITASQVGLGRRWEGLAAAPVGTEPMAAHERFHWDAASNPLAEPAGAALPNNRLRVWQDMQFAYDAHGNLTARLQGKRHSAAQTITWFAWDAAHQLTQATVVRGTEDSGGQTTQTFRYAYDALGRRIAKTDAFGTTVFAWDGDQLHSEQRGSRHTQYLYQPGSFVPLAQIHDGTLHHLHTDHLGTPLEASNDAGRITWRVTYRTWGNVLVQEEEEITQNLRFQGQYFDQETGLHYNRFRYYDPGPGRFVSQDPIGLEGGVNLFQYAPNSVEWIDPFGLNPKKPNQARRPCDCDKWSLDRKDRECKGHVPGVGYASYFRDPSSGLWYSKDLTGHGDSAFKMFEEQGGKLVHKADLNEYGDIMNKHKSKVGEEVDLKKMKCKDL